MQTNVKLFDTDKENEEVRKNCGEVKEGLKGGDRGFIQSPNYPNAYPAGTECEWALKVIQFYFR